MYLFDKIFMLFFTGSSSETMLLSILLKGTILLALVSLITTVMRKNSATSRHLLWNMSLLSLDFLLARSDQFDSV